MTGRPDWALIAAIGSMVAFWVTALVILYQIRHMQVARNMEVAMRMFEWSESARMRSAIHWVITRFELEDYLKQTDPEPDYPEIAIAFFEQAGIMIQKRFVNKDVVLDHIAMVAVRCWRQLEPLIMHRRKEYDDERIGEHFEFLYKQALSYEAQGHKRNLSAVRVRHSFKPEPPLKSEPRRLDEPKDKRTGHHSAGA